MSNIAVFSVRLSSIAMMLRFGLDLGDAAAAVEDALNAVIEAGDLTADLGGKPGCQAVGQKVAERI